MILRETRLGGAYIIEPERLEDERGFFALAFCARTFERRGLSPRLAQCNISYSARKGTLRGMHWQIAPHAQIKLIRCTMGAIWDVIVDLRPSSPTRREWLAVELNAENRRMLYVPEGFAHGFQTLADRTEVFYQMSEAYDRASERGFRWNDPAIGIPWPDEPSAISARDRELPLLDSQEGHA